MKELKKFDPRIIAGTRVQMLGGEYKIVDSFIMGRRGCTLVGMCGTFRAHDFIKFTNRDLGSLDPHA